MLTGTVQQVKAAKHWNLLYRMTVRWATQQNCKLVGVFPVFFMQFVFSCSSQALKNFRVEQK